MAMLAEPKRKRKWSLNPRGKLWTNDETKIGQKLLEKMGWSKGKGLGREEQGDLEPVRLKYKNDAEGVGYEAKDDQWVAHREEFNNILGALNGSHAPVDIAEPIPVKSLEVRSKSSKARVHYHKFTRGKDLSRYSASDMACILGKRANVVVEEKEPEVKEEVEEKSGDGDVEHLHGVTTIHRGSIQEYFASKMAAVREKQNLASTDKESQPSTDSETNVDERENEKRVRINEELNVVKEFFAKEKIIKKNSQDPKDSVTTDTNEETPKKKKKKSKTKEESVTTEVLPINDVPETKKKKKRNSDDVIVEPIVTEDEQTKIKKTKKRKLEEVVGNGEIVEDTQPDQKKKKKKNKIEEETTPGDTVPIENDTHLVKKKKKKSKKEEDEPSDNTLSNGDIEPAVNGECKKSKKKNEKVVIETTVQNDDEDDLQQPKKKKKKSKKEEEATPCVVLNGDSFAETETISSESKKSKKNKFKEVVSEPTQIAENGDVEQPKKKKKKSKRGDEVVTEKYKILEDSFVDMERDTMTPKSEKSDEIAVDLQNGTESDTLQSKKKKKKSKKDEEEAPETFRKLEDSYEESQHDSKVKIKSETKESESKRIDEEPYTKQTTCEMSNDKKEDIKTEQPTSSELKKLATAQLNERRQSAKVTQLLERAEFDKFVGSNLLSIAGYGVGRRFVSS